MKAPTLNGTVTFDPRALKTHAFAVKLVGWLDILEQAGWIRLQYSPNRLDLDRHRDCQLVAAIYDDGVDFTNLLDGVLIRLH